VPDKQAGASSTNDSVFFLQTRANGALSLWVGAGNGQANLRAIRATRIQADQPTDLRVPGFSIPFRVASIPIEDGSRIYLGVSERDELRVLHNLTQRFVLLSLSLILLGFLIVFFTTRRMLSHVRGITEAASRIGHADLTTRVPTTERHDEIAQLALTLNHMLDRIENTVRQLHTITDALAHDLRSPLTAIRGKLEMSLLALDDGRGEPIVGAIEELDRLTDFLNKSLDVAEAQADALRLTLTPVDLSELLTVMADLYEPSMAEKGLALSLHLQEPVRVMADAALLHRMVANLFDNALKHLPSGCAVSIRVAAEHGNALLRVSDNGPGFDAGVLAQLFETRIRGRSSTGHGLGLAFVHAVARAHGGAVTAANPAGGGAQIAVSIPLAADPGAPNRVPAEPALCKD
ncbi:MAG: ATP-binding protein, partial [Acidobacteriota bacterium]